MYLRIAVLGLFLTSLACFLGTRYYDGVIMMLTCVLFLLVVRTAEGYPLSQVMCSYFLSGLQFVWAIVAVILYSTETGYRVPSEKWMQTFMLISVIGAPVSYVRL